MTSSSSWPQSNRACISNVHRLWVWSLGCRMIYDRTVPSAPVRSSVSKSFRRWRRVVVILSSSDAGGGYDPLIICSTQETWEDVQAGQEGTSSMDWLSRQH